MRDTLSSLSRRSIALRILPAAVVLGMLILGPPEALRQKAPAQCGGSLRAGNTAARLAVATADSKQHHAGIFGFPTSTAETLRCRDPGDLVP